MSDSDDSLELHDIDWSQQADPFDYSDPFALSPQITAVITNDVRRLRHLIESGKSANINDNHGNTPLHVAVLKEKAKAFHYLLNLPEVRIDAENFEGATPLLLALLCGHDDFALALIRAGADVNLVKLSGYGPLHYAGSVQVGLSLIDKGALLDVRNYAGETPLFAACERGHWGVVHLLLHHGADPGVPDCEGTLPLDVVLRKGPAHLQEVFFDYTFDGWKQAVSLHTLTSAMVAHSPLFGRIVERTSKVVYDEEDLRQLNTALPRIDSHLFRIFLEEFAEVAEDMFELCSTLMDYITYLSIEINKKPNFVDFFYVLCDSPLVRSVVERYQPKLYLVDSIIQRTTQKTLTQVMCFLWSHGIDVTSDDLNTVYKQYGFCELFKVMLHMDIVDCPVPHSEANFGVFLMPMLVYEVHLEFGRCLEEPQQYMSLRQVAVLKRFFALGPVKEYYLRTFGEDREAVAVVEDVVVAPSLVELARDAARRHIIRSYGVRRSVDLFTVLKWLPISDVYKAILSYEMEIYRF